MIPKLQYVSDSFRTLACKFEFSIINRIFSKWINKNNEEFNEWIAFQQVILNEFHYNQSINQNTNNQDNNENTNFNQKSSNNENDVNNENDDWKFLIQSDYHLFQKNNFLKNNFNIMETFIGKKKINNIQSNLNIESLVSFLTSSQIFSTFDLGLVLICLHSLYENYKLNQITLSFSSMMISFLFKISVLLGWKNWSDYYLKDYPNLISKNDIPSNFSKFSIMPLSPPNIFQWIYETIINIQQKETEITFFPILKGLYSPCSWTRKICRFYHFLSTNKDNIIYLPNFWNASWLATSVDIILDSNQKDIEDRLNSEGSCLSIKKATKLIEIMSIEKFSQTILSYLPIGISIPLYEVINLLTHNPPQNLPKKYYYLMKREDIAQFNSKKDIYLESKSSSKSHQFQNNTNISSNIIGTEIEDEVCFFRFSRDNRLKEVQQLLNSSSIITIEQKDNEGQTDQDIISTQQEQILLFSRRTLSLSIGRGIFTFGTCKLLTTVFY